MANQAPPQDNKMKKAIALIPFAILARTALLGSDESALS
jgi:hypothetical protein